MYIGSGQLSCTFNCSPWKDYWKSISKIVISKEVIAPENSFFLFADLFNVTEIEGLENLDTSKVKNMNGMFVNDTSSLVTLDISNFETNNVENMCKMFAGKDKLTTLNLTNFNFTKVNNRELMLSGMKNLTNLYMDKDDKFKIAGE
ncbi:BspA family leucine-rich repeat surface protein [Enterococcus entomosocium]|uniref:BspA family leucine-rich repeat surface protein n=1 Tax=Enterococcus entomosocium TaxID=3034352 RepID=UPI003BD30840